MMSDSFDQNFCNKIAELCYNKYTSLPRNGKPNEKQWTLLAGIVKVARENENPTFEVISIGTGSKCVGQSKMAPTRLNDCHAEVMARRGFLRYLYDQISQHINLGESVIFSGTDEKGMCIMKEDITFHFFTSHIPCGDASIFPMYDNYSDNTETVVINSAPSVTVNDNAKYTEINSDNCSPITQLVEAKGKILFQIITENEQEKKISEIESNYLQKQEHQAKIPPYKSQDSQNNFNGKSQQNRDGMESSSVHCGLKSQISDHYVQQSAVYGSTYSVGLKRECPFQDENISFSKKPAFSDIYRTGSKCLPEEKLQDPKLPGINYHITGALRGKPGRGDRNLSLSCSDKFAKWVAVGLQGALLSLLLQTPIYFSTLTIGGSSPYSYEALHRAVVGRTSYVLNLKPPYKISKPVFFHSTLPFIHARQPGKLPCAESIVWSAVLNRPLEVAVNGIKKGVTKKAEKSSNCSLLVSKRELLRQFIQCTRIVNGVDISCMTYAQIKDIAKPYREAWDTVRRTCFVAWPCKAREHYLFTDEQ